MAQENTSTVSQFKDIQARIDKLAHMTSKIAQEQQNTQRQCVAQQSQNNSPQFEMPPARSEKIGRLALKLSKAQAEFSEAGHDKSNPFFKSGYTSRAKLISAVNKALAKYDVAYIEKIIHVPNKMPIFRGMVMCETKDGEEQFIASDLDTALFGQKKNVQEMGSVLTYLSRYIMKHLLCIPDGADETDDDGESTMPEEKRSKKYVKKPNEKINKDQLDHLFDILDDHPDIHQKVCDGLKIDKLADVPKETYKKVLNRITERISDKQASHE